MDPIASTLARAALWALAGFMAALFMLNRRLILWPDSRHKVAVIACVVAVLAGGAALAGLALPARPWALVPACVLMLAAAGEFRRFLIRRAHAGSPPLDTRPHQVPYLRPLSTTDIVAHAYAISSELWRGAPLRIVHLSDLHIGNALPAAYFISAMDLALDAKPDLAFITGDFVSRPGSAAMLPGILRPIGRLGTFAVLGNHDYWTGAETVRAALETAGIVIVSGKSVRLDADGRAVLISGTDYPWGGKQWLEPQPEAGCLSLVLSHTPDNIYRLAGRAAHAVFCGHCHAGQVRLPLLGPLVVPSIYGRRFDHGHFVVRGTHLFVSGGVGASNPPFRLYCRPDIFVVDVTAQTPARLRNPALA